MKYLIIALIVGAHFSTKAQISNQTKAGLEMEQYAKNNTAGTTCQVLGGILALYGGYNYESPQVFTIGVGILLLGEVIHLNNNKYLYNAGVYLTGNTVGIRF